MTKKEELQERARKELNCLINGKTDIEPGKVTDAVKCLCDSLDINFLESVRTKDNYITEQHFMIGDIIYFVVRYERTDESENCNVKSEIYGIGNKDNAIETLKHDPVNYSLCEFLKNCPPDIFTYAENCLEDLKEEEKELLKEEKELKRQLEFYRNELEDYEEETSSATDEDIKETEEKKKQKRRELNRISTRKKLLEYKKRIYQSFIESEVN